MTTEDGTGIVHLAPAFGEDDYRVAGAAREVPFDPSRAGGLYNPVRPDGTFDERVLDRNGESYEGRFVKDAVELVNAAGEWVAPSATPVPAVRGKRQAPL